MAVNAGLFIAILFDEWRRGRRQEAGEQAFADEGDADEQDDEQEQEQARQDDYAAALALLGLSEPFTQADLKRLYRKAMKTAHPDAGGAKETAQALNTARDLIAALKGWK
jgi:DnaJ-domain-containing protein 1